MATLDGMYNRLGRCALRRMEVLGVATGGGAKLDTGPSVVLSSAMGGCVVVSGVGRGDGGGVELDLGAVR